MRRLSNTLSACAALALFASTQDPAKTDDAFGVLPASVRLQMIRDAVSAAQSAASPDALRMTQYYGFRNCVSGYWRNC